MPKKSTTKIFREEDWFETDLYRRVSLYVDITPMTVKAATLNKLIHEFVEREGGMKPMKERFPDEKEDLAKALVEMCVDFLETRLPPEAFRDRGWAHGQFKGWLC